MNLNKLPILKSSLDYLRTEKFMVRNMFFFPLLFNHFSQHLSHWCLINNLHLQFTPAIPDIISTKIVSFSTVSDYAHRNTHYGEASALPKCLPSLKPSKSLTWRSDFTMFNLLQLGFQFCLAHVVSWKNLVLSNNQDPIWVIYSPTSKQELSSKPSQGCRLFIISTLVHLMCALPCKWPKGQHPRLLKFQKRSYFINQHANSKPDIKLNRSLKNSFITLCTRVYLMYGGNCSRNSIEINTMLTNCYHSPGYAISVNIASDQSLEYRI